VNPLRVLSGLVDPDVADPTPDAGRPCPAVLQLVRKGDVSTLDARPLVLPHNGLERLEGPGLVVVLANVCTWARVVREMGPDDASEVGRGFPLALDVDGPGSGI